MNDPLHGLQGFLIPALAAEQEGQVAPRGIVHVIAGQHLLIDDDGVIHAAQPDQVYGELFGDNPPIPRFGILVSGTGRANQGIHRHFSLPLSSQCHTNI